MRVLVVEDEPTYVEALKVVLKAEGFDVDAVMDGRDAIKAIRSASFDVVLLDLMLPSVSGLDVLRAVREFSSVPVIVLSAKNAEADVVSALELGADDYITKPYSARELVARLRAVARRAMLEPDGGRWTVGSVTLDTGTYELTVGSDAFSLPRKEFEVMAMLIEESGRIVTRGRLLDDVWGIGWGDTKSLDQHIRRLRRKLEVDERAPTITTVRGVGYRLEE